LPARCSTTWAILRPKILTILPTISFHKQLVFKRKSATVTNKF
jgi:hypothetical protein